jgi:parallel beta-helix repeat protein
VPKKTTFDRTSPVVNDVVDGVSNGIDLYNVRGTTIAGNTVSNCAPANSDMANEEGSGFRLDDCSGLTLEGNQATGCLRGFEAVKSFGFTFRNCSADENPYLFGGLSGLDYENLPILLG